MTAWTAVEVGAAVRAADGVAVDRVTGDGLAGGLAGAGVDVGRELGFTVPDGGADVGLAPGFSGPVAGVAVAAFDATGVGGSLTTADGSLGINISIICRAIGAAIS